MRDTPADDLIPAAVYPEAVIPEVVNPDFAPKVLKAEPPCDDPVKAIKDLAKSLNGNTKAPKKKKQHHKVVHHYPAPPSMCNEEPCPSPFGISPGIARAALDAMDGEPIDSLARRAMDNLNNNGVSNDVRDMARKALDNLNGGQSGAPGGI